MTQFLGAVSETALVPGEVLIDQRTGDVLIYDPSDARLGFNPFKAIGKIAKGAFKGVKSVVRTGIKIGGKVAPYAAGAIGAGGLGLLAAKFGPGLLKKITGGGRSAQRVPEALPGEPVQISPGVVDMSRQPMPVLRAREPQRVEAPTFSTMPVDPRTQRFDPRIQQAQQQAARYAAPAAAMPPWLLPVGIGAAALVLLPMLIRR